MRREDEQERQQRGKNELISANGEGDEPEGEPAAGVVGFLRVTDFRVILDVFQQGVEMEEDEPAAPEWHDIQSISFLEVAPVFIDPVADEDSKADNRHADQAWGRNIEVGGLRLRRREGTTDTGCR